MGIAEFIAGIVAFVLALVPVHTVSYVAPVLESTAPKTARVLIVGDMMFDRAIRIVARERGGDILFSCIDPLLREHDLVVGNLEGPITDAKSKSEGSVVGSTLNYTFTFPIETAALLARHNIRVVNLGNNHISNFGLAGIRATEHYLDVAGVRWFGDPIDQRVATSTVRGIPLAFINYNQFEGSSTASTTIVQIRAGRAVGEVPIVYAHWGDEYVGAAALEKRLAKQFIDAGAELVVGSHPHIVQEHEEYAGKHIYYSLGNFIFDQYWNDAVRHGLALSVTLDAFGVRSIEEIPVELQHDRRTCPL